VKTTDEGQRGSFKKGRNHNECKVDGEKQSQHDMSLSVPCQFVKRSLGGPSGRSYPAIFKSFLYLFCCCTSFLHGIIVVNVWWFQVLLLVISQLGFSE